MLSTIFVKFCIFIVMLNFNMPCVVMPSVMAQTLGIYASSS